MKKTLIVIGCVAIAVVALFFLMTANSQKLICKSSEGSITILYDENSINGYTVVNMSYDLDAAQEYAEQIGVEAYLDEFELWFSSNLNGSCTRK